MMLYLARNEDGEWLSQKDAVSVLQREIDPTAYQLMDPGKTLDSEEYFGFQPLPAHFLHVLVVLPPRKRKHPLSRIGIKAGDDILRGLTIIVRDNATPQLTVADNSQVVGKFAWEDTKREDQHCIEYKTYFENNLRSVQEAQNLCVVGVEYGKNFLTITIRGHEFSGRSDLLILSEEAIGNRAIVNELKDARLVVEVKKAVASTDHAQATA